MAGEGTLYQKKDTKKWWLVVSKGYDPNYNKGKGGYPQDWIDLETTDEKEAISRAKVIRGQLEDDSLNNPAKITLADLLGRWMDYTKKKRNRKTGKPLKRRTIEEYEKIVKTYLNGGLSKMTLPKIHSKHIRDLLQDIESPFAANKVYIILNSAYKLGISDGDLGIRENPCEKILEKPVVPDKKHKTWTSDEAKRFLLQVRFAREYGVFLCCLTTGMRIGEVLGLRWCDIDMEKRTIAVRQTLEQKEKGNPDPRFGTPKTDASQADLLMTDMLCKEFERIKKRQGEEKKKAKKLYRDYDLVFCNFNGTPIHLENLRNRVFNKAIKDLDAEVKKIDENASFPKIRIHDMRHSAATLLLSQKVPLEIIQRYLRHANRQTTEIYAHNEDPKLLKEATKAMERAFR